MTLKILDILVQTKEVTIGPGETETVTFEVVFDSPVPLFAVLVEGLGFPIGFGGLTGMTSATEPPGGLAVVGNPLYWE